MTEFDRNSGLGGSEAAAACGLSKWKTPYELYLQKIGELPGHSTETPVQSRGKRFEPLLRQMYMEQTGRTVTVPQGAIQSDKVPFMFVSPDGLTEDGRYLEIKTARNRSEWGEPGTDEVPQDYLLQVQHGLFVTKIATADIYVAFSLDDVELYEVREDKELQDMIIEEEGKFWRCVETRTPPDLTTYQDVILRFRRSSGTPVTATPEIEMLVPLLRNIKGELKKFEDAEEKTKAELMRFMGEHDVLLDVMGNVLTTWKETKATQRFDVKAFQEAYPEIHKEFMKVGDTQRRFLIKG